MLLCDYSARAVVGVADWNAVACAVVSGCDLLGDVAFKACRTCVVNISGCNRF